MIKEDNIKLNEEAQEYIHAGLNLVANAVKVTLGPKGRTVLIGNTNSIIVTKDGATVAENVKSSDPKVELGVKLTKEASSKTLSDVGDGTTTATVLAQAIVEQGLTYIKDGANPIDIKKGVDEAVTYVIKDLKEKARLISDEKSLINVASISANNDSHIGSIIGSAIVDKGLDSSVTLDKSTTGSTYIDTIEGYVIDSGYVSDSFCNNDKMTEVTLMNVPILIINGAVDSLDSLVPILTNLPSKDLIIVSDTISAATEALLIENFNRGSLNVVAIKSPSFNKNRTDILNDLGVAVGANVKPNIDKLDISDLGIVNKVIVKADKTIFIPTSDNQSNIDKLVESLKNRESTAALKQRISNLAGGVSVIYVGASSEAEMKETYDRVDDAIHATYAALSEGVVPGGGIALVKTSRLLNKLTNKIPDRQLGIQVVIEAIRRPAIQILRNAGIDEQIIDQILNNDDYNIGYDIASDRYVDMYNSGIIDPVKVTRVALENAASIATMILLTGCLIYID